MLVYANNLSFEGTDSEEAVFRGIGVWLKEQLGFGLHPAQLREEAEHRGRGDKSGSWLRIYATDEDEPQMYAWVLKVSGGEVKGRQWVTELGLKILNKKYEFSCVLKTEEHSTMVNNPVTPSQPRVIRYIASNIESAPGATLSANSFGTSTKIVGPAPDTYRALLVDIERQDRRYPIVLISPDRDGNYHVNSNHLQQLLLGLAQVVQVDGEYNSYEMAEVLGNQWSAWDGAVNLISTPAPSGFVRGKVFRTVEIDSWGDTQHDRVSALLAWVTHHTNIPQLRRRIRVEGVMQLSLRRRIQLSRARSSDMSDELSSVWQLAEEQTDQIDDLEGNIRELEETNEHFQLAKLDDEIQHQALNDELRKKDFDISALKKQLKNAGYGQTATLDIASILELLIRPGQPTPLECMDLIESFYPDTCIVLPSAKDSARKVSNFMYGQKLLGLLRSLVTEYIEKLKQGGDNIAKSVFGKNDYAANESETVESNPNMRKKRRFEYNGEMVEMFRHLRIGREEDTTKTIRVHFYWDAKNGKIVIGYCGEHLPVSTH
ncbi:MAG: tektin family protein [Gammaproteobacteria bacterium]|nr:tektin family protein [Gammaproteobacteria bacterium]